MEAFKTGDIVQLKSGGPKMTVESARGREYNCQWFAGNKLERGYFQHDSLKLVTEPEVNKK